VTTTIASPEVGAEALGLKNANDVWAAPVFTGTLRVAGDGLHFEAAETPERTGFTVSKDLVFGYLVLMYRFPCREVGWFDTFEAALAAGAAAGAAERTQLDAEGRS